MTTGEGSSKDYKLELRAALGGGVLALDDISIDLVPLVGEQYVREEEEEGNESSTGSQEQGINPTDAPAIDTTDGSQVNATEIQPIPAQGSNPTEKVEEGNEDGRTTVTGGEQAVSEEEGQGVESTATSPDISSLTSTSRPGSASCANNSSNCTEAELVGEEKQDTSVYGYTGEVGLFLLKILFLQFSVKVCLMLA